MLTPAQLITLKAAILADPVLNAYPNTSDGNFDMASGGLTQNLGLRAPAEAPNNVVWKSNVSITGVGDNIVASELAGLSTLNNTRLQTLVALSASGVNPSLSDRRAFFDLPERSFSSVGTNCNTIVLKVRTPSGAVGATSQEIAA